MSFSRIGVLLPLSLGAALAQNANPPAGGPKAAGAGLAIYRRHCSSCHGNQADGGRAPNLTRGSLSDTQIFRTISNGVSGTEMAAYESRLSSDDIWRIVIFLGSAARSESTRSWRSIRPRAKSNVASTWSALPRAAP
jgi:mono/diheme cytochrome c family protein